jgi:hypothetical protein
MFSKKLKKITMIICLASFFSYMALGEIGAKQMTGGPTANPVTDIKKTVVFLGRINPDGKPQIYATGFLVKVQETYHLLTAKHVVVNKLTGKMQDDNLLAFFNLRGGGITVRSIADMKKQFGIDWTFHQDPKVDIAIIPFLINPAEDDVRVISDNLFLGPEYLAELYDVFFLSYQPGIEPRGKVTPIVRNGIISLINDDRSFYVDASVFPGNSGSPVFLKPSAIRFGEKEFVIGKDLLGGRFIGITGEYITSQELAISAQTGRPRVVFEENTGLSRVWSVVFIKEIIDSDGFKQQLKKVAGK